MRDQMSNNIGALAAEQEKTMPTCGEWENQEENMVCPLTRRVMVISPFPGRIHDLTHSLSKVCFDVMVFHRWQPGVTDVIPADLLIFDLTNGALNEEGMEQTIPAELGEQIPVLYLLNNQALSSLDHTWMDKELLIWPASPQETLFRVKRMARHGQSPCNVVAAKKLDRTVFKDLWIDRKKMTVHRGGERVELTKTQYDLLLQLIEGEGSVLSRDELMNAVWGTDFFGGSNVVDVHVKTLRKKLGDSPANPRYIVTVRGVGYRLAD